MYRTRLAACLLLVLLLPSCRKDDGGTDDKAPDLAPVIGRLDMNYLYALQDTDPRVWDDLHAIATLQGIVNRKTATLYINYVGYDHGFDIDKYWWDKYSKTGEWLAGKRTRKLSSVEDAVREYADMVKGAVVYDSSVASTSNVASAVAGIEDLVAIRYDTTPGSLYDRLVVSGPKLPVKVWLLNENGTSMFTGKGTVPGTSRTSTGSAKCDAYYWFIDNYIKKGKCDTRWGAYYIDQFWRTCTHKARRSHHCLTNHDFFVSKKAFFFDLSPWGDEAATDDPSQPVGTDLNTLKDLLLEAYKARSADEFCYIGGFPSWAHKYSSFNGTGGLHHEGSTEAQYTLVISGYNACMDADAIAYGVMANASFWQHFPLRDEYTQKWTTRDILKKRGFVGSDGKVDFDNGKRDYFIFYAGDYDASSWIYQRAYDIWDDPARGSVPIMWAVGPALSLRAPQVMHYFYSTRSANDYFVAADSGAGYINPGELQTPRASGLPSGINAWKKHCSKFYSKWGMTVSGFIIDNYSVQMNSANLDAYASFSPNGIVPQKASSPIFLHKGMPVMTTGSVNVDASMSAEDAAASLIAQIKEERKTGRRFHWCRVVLAKPSWYRQVIEELERQSDDIVYLDAPSFFELLRIYKEK